MPEDSPPNHPAWVQSAPPQRPGDAHQAVATALGSTTVLTARWGLLCGLTERHYATALPVVGALLALALTSTPPAAGGFRLWRRCSPSPSDTSATSPPSPCCCGATATASRPS